MTDEEFFEKVIHTDHADVPALKDATAGQFLLKMASLVPGFGLENGTPVRIYFTPDLGLRVQTPLGRYSFVLDASDGSPLVVDQII